jgi:hypothetical protein
MRPRFARFTFFAVVASSAAFAPLALLAACGSAVTDPGGLQVTPARDAGKSKGDAADPVVVDPPADGSVVVDPPGGPGRVYAHTTDTLYLYEPVSGTLKKLGAFTFDKAGTESAIIDIAVDRTGNMYATTFSNFFSIDTSTAKCTWIATTDPLVDFPNSLSFVPAGTVDPGKETLVGYASNGDNVAVTYVKIDTTTGLMTTLGDMNATVTGPQYRSSGDIISLIQDGNRTYATVKLQVDGGASGTDLLAEVDPADGHLKRIIGDTKQTNLFGFGYWAGKGYGFSDTGRIVQIDMNSGNSVVLLTLTSDAGAALPWYGAGVTTQAPIR